MYQTLAGRDQVQAFEVFKRIRNGDDASTILRHIQNGSIEESVSASYNCRTRQKVVVILAQSTASLREIVSLASTVFSPDTRVNVPAGEVFEPLKNRIITLEILTGVLADANPPRRSIESSANPKPTLARVADGTYDGPLFWVPASPWTRLTDDDEAVSHIISVFLTTLSLGCASSCRVSDRSSIC